MISSQEVKVCLKTVVWQYGLEHFYKKSELKYFFDLINLGLENRCIGLKAAVSRKEKEVKLPPPEVVACFIGPERYPITCLLEQT